MKGKGTAFIVAFLLAAATILSLRASARAQSPPKTVTCSFSNPSYSGWCKQTAPIPQGGSADQVCQNILSCLNDTQCNETFCNATQIRGGWKLEKTETGQ
jgi:hypothetical protein